MSDAAARDEGGGGGGGGERIGGWTGGRCKSVVDRDGVVLNEDLRFIPKLLPMDLSWRDWFCAMSRTLRALSRELERLRLGMEWALVAEDWDVEDARRAAAARPREEAIGEVL